MAKKNQSRIAPVTEVQLPVMVGVDVCPDGNEVSLIRQDTNWVMVRAVVHVSPDYEDWLDETEIVQDLSDYLSAIVANRMHARITGSK